MTRVTDTTLIKTNEDEEPLTWVEFVEANTTNDADWLEQVKADLEQDGEHWEGSGAAPLFHITLVAREQRA